MRVIFKREIEENMSFQFGNLPYGYNPFSNGMTTLGGAYGDTPVWNLADAQVRSQMTGPLFANMTPAYNTQIDNSTDFYNNLLMNQARMSGSTSQASGSKMIQDLFQMMLMMKQLEKLNNTSEKSSSSSNKTDDYKTIEGVEDDELEGDGGKTDAKTEFKFDEKKPLNALKSFIKNTDDESTFEFADDVEFAKATFAELKDKDGKVSLDSIKKLFGIDFNKLPRNKKEEAQKALNELITDTATNSDPKSVTLEKY
jgi:hypothetical protein